LLRKCRIAINVSKSMAMLFTRRRIQNPRPVALFGEPIVWVDTARYLGVTLDKRLTWASHIDQVRKKASQRLGVLGRLLNRRSGLSIRNGVLLFRQLIRPMMDYACPLRDTTSESFRCFNPSVFASLLVHLGTSVAGKFTRIWEFRFSPTSSEP
jgi:hypothetical protein